MREMRRPAHPFECGVRIVQPDRERVLWCEAIVNIEHGDPGGNGKVGEALGLVNIGTKEAEVLVFDLGDEA